MNRVYLIVRNKDSKKTIRRIFPDVLTALAFINTISSVDYSEVTEIKMEID